MLLPPLLDARDYPACIRDSTIAGKGLFAKRVIEKGETIAEYGGKLEWKSTVLRREELSDCIEITRGSDGVFLNAHGEQGTRHAESGLAAWARFANSPKGTGLSANAAINIEIAVFTQSGRTRREPLVSRLNYPGVRAYLRAKRQIEAGEEILVSYGAGYSHF